MCTIPQRSLSVHLHWEMTSMLYMAGIILFANTRVHVAGVAVSVSEVSTIVSQGFP